LAAKGVAAGCTHRSSATCTAAATLAASTRAVYRSVSPRAADDHVGERVFDRAGGAGERVAQRGSGGDQQQRVAAVFTWIGVLLHDRVRNGVGEADGGGPGGHRRRDPCFLFGRDGGDDRLLAAGEVVVVGPW